MRRAQTARGIVGEAYATARRAPAHRVRPRARAAARGRRRRRRDGSRRSGGSSTSRRPAPRWTRHGGDCGARSPRVGRSQPPARRGSRATSMRRGRCCRRAGGRSGTPPTGRPTSATRVAQALVESGIEAARFAPDESIRAGLAVRAGNNVLDATLEGLLADRAATEGRLLAHLEGSDAPEHGADHLDRRAGAPRAGVRAVPAARSRACRRRAAARRSAPDQRGRDRRPGLRGHDRAQAGRRGRGDRRPARDSRRTGAARRHLRRVAAAPVGCGRALHPARDERRPGGELPLRAPGSRRRLRFRRQRARRGGRGAGPRPGLPRAAGRRGRSDGHRRAPATTRTTRRSPRCAGRTAGRMRSR